MRLRPALLYVIFACVGCVTALALEDVWVHALSEIIRGKLITTLAIIAVAAGAAYAIAANIDDETKKKDKGYLD